MENFGRYRSAGTLIALSTLLVSPVAQAELGKKSSEPRTTTVGSLYQDFNEYERILQARMDGTKEPYNPKSETGKYNPPDASLFPNPPRLESPGSSSAPYEAAAAPYRTYRIASLLRQYQDPAPKQKSKKVMYQGAQYCFAKSVEVVPGIGVEPIEGNPDSPIKAVFVTGDRPTFARGGFESTENKVHFKIVFNDASGGYPDSVMDVDLTAEKVKNLTGHSLELYPHLKGKIAEKDLLPRENPPDPKSVWLQGLYDNPTYRLSERDNDYIQIGQTQGSYLGETNTCKPWKEPHHRLNAEGVRQLTAILLGRSTPDGKGRDGGFVLNIGPGWTLPDGSMGQIFAKAHEPDHNDVGVVGWAEAVNAFNGPSKPVQTAIRKSDTH